MSQWKVKLQNMNAVLDAGEQLLKTLQQSTDEIQNIKNNLGMQIRQKEYIDRNLQNSVENLRQQHQIFRQMIRTGRQAVLLYQTTEQNVSEQYSGGSRKSGESLDAKNGLAVGGENLDGNADVFDDQGGYGGDQGDLEHNKSGWKFLFWRFGADKELFDFVRTYDNFQNYSNDEIVALYKKINSEGCGYVAFANNIFVEFEGREQEFEEVFGFPMYNESGDFNFNRLLIDFYASTDDRYDLNQPDGSLALVHAALSRYMGREEEFREKYGVELYLNGDRNSGCWNEEAMQRILDEYQGQDIVELEQSGMSGYEMNNRIHQYMSDKGIHYESEFVQSPQLLGTEQIDQYLDSGKNINIVVSDFNLYNENGDIVHGDVGGHWMTITGTTEDGRYIVSSWGERYYIRPDEIPMRGQYMITDISV